MQKKPELTEEQQKEKEINELIMTEDNIEMTAHLEHCPECQQGGVNGVLKIFSLAIFMTSMRKKPMTLRTGKIFLAVSDKKCDFGLAILKICGIVVC